MGNLFMGLGIAIGGVVYLVTVYLLFAAGETGMAALALFVPPADLILAFFVSPTLGVAAILAIVCLLVGAGIKGEEA